MFNLLHLDMMPVFYGLIMFIGIKSMYDKLVSFRLKAFIIEGGVFWLVFAMHGGTMTGGFSAMICALLAGFFLGRERKLKGSQQ